MTDKHEKTPPWEQTYTIKPVGYVKSKLKNPSLMADQDELSQSGNTGDLRLQAKEIKELVSTIVVNPSLEGILDGLEKFSHALIIYWPHLGRKNGRNLIRVHPMGRQDLKKVGIFASCSPARPNPLLVTAVKVLGIEKNVLTVQGLEAVNESPIMDIKPYNRHYLQAKDLKLADWMEEIEQEPGV